MSGTTVPAPAPDFERIFAEHSMFAWRVLARFGVHERELEDACQEVFMIVFRGLSQFEGRSSLRTWIYGICRRVAANQRARAVHRREVLGDPPLARPAEATTEVDGFEALANKQALSLLDGLLSCLSPEQREVFVLYEIEELSMREVAGALDCSPNTAYARLAAARREIEAALKRLRAKRRVA